MHSTSIPMIAMVWTPKEREREEDRTRGGQLGKNKGQQLDMGTGQEIDSRQTNMETALCTNEHEEDSR